MTTFPFRPDHADPAVTAHHGNTAAFLSQLDTRPRNHEYEAPLPGDCYCGCRFDDHDAIDDMCNHCDNCNEYVEHTEVIATRNTLDTDDELNEGRRRDNNPAAINLARRARARADR